MTVIRQSTTVELWKAQFMITVMVDDQWLFIQYYVEYTDCVLTDNMDDAFKFGCQDLKHIFDTLDYCGVDWTEVHVVRS